MQPLIAVIGATGSGKTALAEALALRFNGELVSCDAKQVYRGMDIGTNKEKKLRVHQHLLDIKEPGERVTVAEYQTLAYGVIGDIHKRGKVPFLVGGSMLYAEAVMNGYEFLASGKSGSQKPRYWVLKIGVAVDREELKQKLALRTQDWLDQGMLNEIKKLLAAGVSPDWLDECGLEYRYFTQHVEGKLTLDEAIQKTNTALNQYVKRQYTWWRRHSDIVWVESQDEAARHVERFLHG